MAANIHELMCKAYPSLTEAEREEALLDLRLVCRWLLDQWDKGNPAFDDLKRP